MSAACVIGLVIGIFALLLCGGVFCLHCGVNDRKVGTNGWQADGSHRVLAVFAHPDDEVMVSGTLAKLSGNGSKVRLLYLTHGEDGPTGGIVEKEKLGEYREGELAGVREILKPEGMEILNYPDRYLNTVDSERLKKEIRDRICSFRPDTVICFDDIIGLYGHTDHVCAGKCTQEVVREQKLTVRHLLVMTLPGRMIGLAMKVSKTFRERYDTSHGLPAADLAVKMSSRGKQKHQVVCVHKTQWQVMRDVQPLYHKIPYQIYYRIFSREYFQYFSL